MRVARSSVFRVAARVVGFRLRAGWRRALSEKGKLVFGLVVGALLLLNFLVSLGGMEEAPGRDVPVDTLFALIGFFVLMTLFQMAPLAPWFNRQEGARFGLTVGRRAALATGTNLVGLAMLLVLLNEVLALTFSGDGRPRGAEWVFEGMDVVSGVVAMVAAGPTGAVILGARGRRRGFGAVLGLLLLGVLAASALEPMWASEALWGGVAANGGRLAALVVLLWAAFVVEQWSPDDRGAKSGKKRRRPAGEVGTTERTGSWFGLRRRGPAEGNAPVGIRARPIVVVALAEARMMLRLRQVRLNMVFSWIMPVFMAIVLRSEELPGGIEAAPVALWTTAGLAVFLHLFWIAFFANLFGFTADGARRLAMSAERALGACLTGKALGTMTVVGALGFAQLTVASVLLAEGLRPADRAIPYYVAALSLVALTGSGAVVSIWLPRKPKLHEQRDFYCSILGLVALFFGWLFQVSIFVAVLVAARLLGGPGVAVLTTTALLVLVAGGCAALVVSLAKGDWLRRRLREWAVTV